MGWDISVQKPCNSGLQSAPEARTKVRYYEQTREL